MEADGADLIDIGGESTRPGAEPVSAAEELLRVVPVLRALHGLVRVPISIDTYKADVAHAAIEAGAAIVNDVSGLSREPELANVVASSGAALILMHSRGSSKSMYAEAEYQDLVAEVIAELGAGIATAIGAGVGLSASSSIRASGLPNDRRTAMVCWPAWRSSRLRSIARCSSDRRASRSCAKRSTGGRAAGRDWGTAAAVTAAVLGGAHIVRVHAVPEMVQVVRVAEEIRTSRAEP